MSLSALHSGLYTPHLKLPRPSVERAPIGSEQVYKPKKAAHENQTDKQINTKPSADGILRPPSVRSSFSLDPTRELKALDIDPRQAKISKTFLDIAHYEESFHLVDTFA